MTRSKKANAALNIANVLILAGRYIPMDKRLAVGLITGGIGLDVYGIRQIIKDMEEQELANNMNEDDIIDVNYTEIISA